MAYMAYKAYGAYISRSLRGVFFRWCGMLRRSRNEESTISQTCLKEIGGLLISDLPQGSHTTAKATLKVFGSTFLQKGAKKEIKNEGKQT